VMITQYWHCGTIRWTRLPQMIRAMQQSCEHGRISRALSGRVWANKNYNKPGIGYITLCKATRIIITYTMKTDRDSLEVLREI
jgi:hypothetical protein